MAILELDEVRLHYELSGTPDNPVLVLSNSLGADLSMWFPQVAELSRHFHLLRYDTRGHGGSSTPSGPYSIAQLANDLLDLLDHLDIERASICGISMGGMVSLWMGIHAADRVDRLILANTAAHIGTLESWNTRIATVEAQGLEPVVPAILERWYTPAFRTASPEVVEHTRAMIAATSVPGYVACCAAVRDADFRHEANAVHAPALVLSGAYDQVTTPADGHFLQSQMAHANYRQLTAAHLSNQEAAEQFNAAVLHFLQN
jgi:3-oxoadipate enol-lactonase